MAEGLFDEVWGKRHFTSERPPPRLVEVDPRRTCGDAKEFEQWIEALLRQHPPNNDLITINQLKVALTDRWHELHRSLPAKHRTMGDGTRGHRCVFAVYMEAYDNLLYLERAIVPVQIAPPQKSPCEDCPTVKRLVASLANLTTVDRLMIGQQDPEFYDQ